MHAGIHSFIHSLSLVTYWHSALEPHWTSITCHRASSHTQCCYLFLWQHVTCAGPRGCCCLTNFTPLISDYVRATPARVVVLWCACPLARVSWEQHAWFQLLLCVFVSEVCVVKGQVVFAPVLWTQIILIWIKSPPLQPHHPPLAESSSSQPSAAEKIKPFFKRRVWRARRLLEQHADIRTKQRLQLGGVCCVTAGSSEHTTPTRPSQLPKLPAPSSWEQGGRHRKASDDGAEFRLEHVFQIIFHLTAPFLLKERGFACCCWMKLLCSNSTQPNKTVCKFSQSCWRMTGLPDVTVLLINYQNCQRSESR